MDYKCLGVVNGLPVFLSDTALAQCGERRIRQHFGILKKFPVVTDLNFNTVMVEADSWRKAIDKYLISKRRRSVIRVCRAG